MSRQRIRVLSLGGTIAMTPSDGGGVTPALDADDLVAAVPGLDEVARVEPESFRQVPGAHLRRGDLVALAAHVDALAVDGIDGIVVTQGTDTIEETAFALDLLVSSDIPLVVTGAMRGPTLPGADGPANLLNAVRIASAPVARGCGTLVTLDDVVHAARFVRKAHTSRPSAFVSAPAGPIGWVSEDRVRIPTPPRRRVHVPVEPSARMPRIGLFTAALDDATDRLAAHGDDDGLVIEAMGAGHLPAATADAAADLARRIPVVLASRTGAGETYRSTYGFPGAEIDLLARGLRSARFLDGLKARLLLSFVLAGGGDGDRFEQMAESLTG
jgi:L-asparaginase